MQQAQEAFIDGLHFAALAMMRSILEVILRTHYHLGDGKLVKLVEAAAAKGLFPPEIGLPQIQMLLKLGSDAVHPKSEKLHKVQDVEKEVLYNLVILRILIERTPKYGGER